MNCQSFPIKQHSRTPNNVPSSREAALTLGRIRLLRSYVRRAGNRISTCARASWRIPTVSRNCICKLTKGYLMKLIHIIFIMYGNAVCGVEVLQPGFGVLSCGWVWVFGLGNFDSMFVEFLSFLVLQTSSNCQTSVSKRI